MPSALSPLRLLFVSTSVGPLGSGVGGGVELTLQNLAQELQQRRHHVEVVAPAGSRAAGLSLVPIDGAVQPLAQSQPRDAPLVLPPHSVLAHMWDYARTVQHRYDLVLNFAYDWLPFYLSPFFHCPVAHLVSMGSLSEVMDTAIGAVVERAPATVAMHSRAQAATFPWGDRSRILGNGFDLSQYDLCLSPAPYLGWVGRIAPEKGLEDAIAASAKAGLPLHIWGAMTDGDYWQQLQQQYPESSYKYQGFVPTQQLQQALGRCRGLLVTPKWVEAFGNVVIEALACGVPVIAYRRGGPAELVDDGVTGWLVEPDSVLELEQAIARLDAIDRLTCRQRAEAQYSNQAMGDRVEAWFRDILRSH